MDDLIRSYLTDAQGLVLPAAGVIAALVILSTWWKTRSAGAVLVAIVVACLVVGFLSDPGGIATGVAADMRARMSSTEAGS